MPNAVNYVTEFSPRIAEMYSNGLESTELTSPAESYRLMEDGKTVKIATINMGGYKMHSRAGGFNRQNVANDWITKSLGFDRDIEFFVDSMDVLETNNVLMAGNLTAQFAKTQGIPETDAYRFSKAYSDFIALGGVVDNTPITTTNVLQLFDSYMLAMNNESVPRDGRILFVSNEVEVAINNAQGITRNLGVNTSNNVNRIIKSLDTVQIKPVTPNRFWTKYDFTDGFIPAIGAQRIQMLLVHPSAVTAIDKHRYIKLWSPGTHTLGDGYLYQERKYGDLFVLDNRRNGIMFNAAV